MKVHKESKLLMATGSCSHTVSCDSSAATVIPLLSNKKTDTMESPHAGVFIYFNSSIFKLMQCFENYIISPMQHFIALADVSLAQN